MALRIHTYPHNPRVWKALIAAKYNNVKVEVVEVQMGVDNKTPAFLKMNPLGKVPVLETPVGPVFESNAITKYIARMRNDTGLLGGSFYEQALVDQWLDFVTNELETARGMWLYPVLGFFKFSLDAYTAGKNNTLNALRVLNEYLATNTFLVGKSVTVADLAAYTTIVGLFTTLVGEDERKKLPNLVRWFNTVGHQKQVQAVVGDVTFCKTETLAKDHVAAAESKSDAPAAAGAAGAKGKYVPTPEQVAAAAKKKEQQQKEAAEKAAAKAAQAAADAEEAEAAKAAKVKEPNPLDSLPPSTMALDDVKRKFFQSKPFNADYFPATFFKEFDNAGYCVFECKFKYEDDLKNTTQACNLVDGFVNRCEAVRKYAFGVVHLQGNAIAGSDDFSSTSESGLFIFRGDKIIKEMTDVDDFVEFDWVQLDVTNSADQAKIVTHLTGNKIGNYDVFYRKYIK